MLLTITSITRETPDTYSFRFAKPPNFHYKAGQFLTLIFKFNDKEVRRSYSLGSAPGIDEDIFITVKRKTNGEISRYLHDKFNTGDTVECTAPAGLFTINEAAAQHYVFLAAGSGIVPVFSLIKELLHHYPETDIQLFYQNNNETNTIFKDQLIELQQAHYSRLTTHFYYSNPSDPNLPHIRLNNTNFEQLLKTYNLLLNTSDANTQFYTCGPEAFMRMTEFTLKLNGVSEENIRKENFVIPDLRLTAYNSLLIDPNPKTVTIHLNNTTYKLSVRYPDTILSSALAQHIELPYSCRGGRCSACMAVCKSGKVIMTVNDVLTARDLANGYVLTCTGHPETDVNIEYP